MSNITNILFALVSAALSAKGIPVIGVWQGKVVGTELRWPFVTKTGEVLVSHKGRFFQVIPGKNAKNLFIDLERPVGDVREMKAKGLVRAAKYADFGKQTRQQTAPVQTAPQPAPVEPEPAKAAFVDGRKVMSQAKAEGLVKAQLTKAAKAEAAGKHEVARKARKAAETIRVKYLTAAPSPVQTEPKAQPKGLEQALEALSLKDLQSLLEKTAAILAAKIAQ